MMLASLPLGYAQCPPMGTSTGVSPTLRVDLRAMDAPVKTGSPLWIEVTLSNPTDHDISFWKSTNPNYAVEVVDESGKPLPDKRPGYRHAAADLLPPCDVGAPERVRPGPRQRKDGASRSSSNFDGYTEAAERARISAARSKISVRVIPTTSYMAKMFSS